MIFFYPDADNLERQWQTIEEDEDEKNPTDAPHLFDKGDLASFVVPRSVAHPKSHQKASRSVGTAPL